MKKSFFTVLTAFAAMSLAMAYNPPVQGENLFGFTNPEQVTGGASSAGGGIRSITPSSTIWNPATGGLEECPTIDVGYTALFSGKESDLYGQAFGTGIIVPTDWCNVSGEIAGVFVPFKDMQLGNSFNLKFSVAKELIDKLYVGVGLGTGFFSGYETDWSLTADAGAIYAFGDLGFLRDFRVGASVLNIGKVYNQTEVYGADGRKNSAGFSGFPYFVSLRSGVATKVVDNDVCKVGLSVDVTTPFFQNLIIDSGVQVELFDFIRITSSWQYNAYEYAQDRGTYLPTVGIVFKLNINTGASDYMKKHDWQTSELSPSAAWKNVNGDVNAISVGTVLRLGALDNDAPDIEIWN